MSEQFSLFDEAPLEPELEPARAHDQAPAPVYTMPGPEHFAAVANDPITRAQRRIWPPGPRPMVNRTRDDYRRTARWWELEASRGYPSSEMSANYAKNMRWLSELAGLYGPGTVAELHTRAGVVVKVNDKGLFVPLEESGEG